MANNINISSVISPNLNNVISKASTIKSFGGQIKDKNKENLIVGDQTKIAQIDNELNFLTKKEQEVGEEKNKIEQEAIYKLNTKQITQDQYNSIIKASSAALLTSKALIDVNRMKLQKDKDNIDNNPYNKLLKDQKVVDDKIKSVDKSVKDEENKSKKDLIKQVTSNVTKTLASVISLQLSNSFSTVITQRKKLEELVDQVNLYIDTQVKDKTTVTIATNLRNNAITLIDNNIKKLNRIKNTIDNLNRILTIFGAIITALNLLVLFLPPLTPPGVVKKITDIITKALALISALNILLSISSVLLSDEIASLIELRDRLKEISLKLDDKTIENLNSQQLSDLSDAFLPVGNDYGSYKGFKFTIKEEQNPQFVVKGNKRRYAVAINRYGVESIKSEYSFTQDPNDLIEQLKLVIDQQNLQG